MFYLMHSNIFIVHTPQIPSEAHFKDTHKLALRGSQKVDLNCRDFCPVVITVPNACSSAG